MSIFVKELPDDDPLFTNQVDYDLDLSGDQPEEDQDTSPVQQPDFGMGNPVAQPQSQPEQPEAQPDPYRAPWDTTDDEPAEYKFGEQYGQKYNPPIVEPSGAELQPAQTGQAQGQPKQWWNEPITPETYFKNTGAYELDGLFRKLEPVKDEKLIQRNKRLAGINAIGEALRSIAEAVGVSKGGAATLRANNLIDKAVSNIEKEESDYKTRMQAYKMLMLKRELDKWGGFQSFLLEQMKSADAMQKTILTAKYKFAQDQAKMEFEKWKAEFLQGNLNTRQENLLKAQKERDTANNEADIKIAGIRSRKSSGGKSDDNEENDDLFYVRIDGKRVGLTQDQYMDIVNKSGVKDPSTYESKDDKMGYTKSDYDLIVSRNAGKYYDSNGNEREITYDVRDPLEDPTENYNPSAIEEDLTGGAY